MDNLLEAVSANNFSAVEQIILQGQDRGEEFSKEPLIYAIEHNQQEMVQLLLDYGFRAYASNNELLMAAVKHNNVPMAQVLFENDINLYENNNEVFLWVLENHKRDVLENNIFFRFPMIEFFLVKDALQHQDIPALLEWVMENNLLELFDLLLQYKINKNIALVKASKLGKVKIVKYLLRKRAKVDFENNSAVRQALENNHLNIVRLLLHAGAVLDDQGLEDFRRLANLPGNNVRNNIRNNAINEAKGIEEKKENSGNNPMVDKLCLTNNTLGGDELKDTDDFVVFLIQTEGKEERGECYLKSELQKFVDNAPDVSLWEGPPSGAGYKGPRHISGEKPIAYPGKKKEGITNRVYRLPWTGTWVTNAVIQRALFSGDLIIVLGGEKMAIGSIFGESNLHGQYGGHWGYLDGNPGEAVYFEDGDFEPDERMMVYNVIDSYR